MRSPELRSSRIIARSFDSRFAIRMLFPNRRLPGSGTGQVGLGLEPVARAHDCIHRSIELPNETIVRGIQSRQLGGVEGFGVLLRFVRRGRGTD